MSVPEPDPRFALANERTLLAYQRTAIGLVAASVAVVHFFGDGVTVALLSVALLVASLVAAVGGYLRFREVAAAIREGRPAGASSTAHLLSLITLVCVAFAAAYVVLRVG